METKPRLFIDMDGVLADFVGALPIKERRYNPPVMFEPGFFLNLRPMKGAISAIRELILSDKYDLHILTQPGANCPISYAEKAQWICMWLPELKNKITMTQNKGLCVGEYLIDDSLKWKEPFEKNGGTFIHFDPDRGSDVVWSEVLNKLLG